VNIYFFWNINKTFLSLCVDIHNLKKTDHSQKKNLKNKFRIWILRLVCYFFIHSFLIDRQWVQNSLKILGKWLHLDSKLNLRLMKWKKFKVFMWTWFLIWIVNVNTNNRDNFCQNIFFKRDIFVKKNLGVRQKKNNTTARKVRHRKWDRFFVCSKMSKTNFDNCVFSLFFELELVYCLFFYVTNRKKFFPTQIYL
jgi:hypothetical protein